jgi:uncharacterized protein involved in response to NO
LNNTTHPILTYAFRPFFLGLGAFAVVVMVLWLLALRGVSASFLTVHSSMWHGHEMLFGFALAAVAGFVLTAVATWTGRPPVQGTPLLLLVATWLMGRLAMTVDVGAPAALIIIGELAFPVLLTGMVAREILIGGSRRNYPVVVIVALLAMLDLCYLLGWFAMVPGIERQSLLAVVYLLVTLITIIGGRIVPSFTANWLRERGIDTLPKDSPWLERTTILLTLGAGLLAVLLPAHMVTAELSAAACIAHIGRLARWRGRLTLSEPLLLILHVGYAWLPIGFGLLAASIAFGVVPISTALHAFAMGGIGTMILAVTSRVALGHTGRPLRAARLTVVAYVLVNAAVLLRLLGGGAGPMVELAAAGWIASWLIFVWVYAPILSGPRAA